MDNLVYVYKTESKYDFTHEELLNIEQDIIKLITGKNEVMNPFEGIIKKGDKVVIKPNLVKESHLHNNDWEYVITHPVVIKSILKYAVSALNNEGEIYIVDAPQTDSDYNKIIKNINLKGIVDEIQRGTDVKIHYYDLREERWFFKQGIIVRRKKLKGDPKGYIKVNLKEKSEFNGKKNMDYYGADYDTKEVKQYHNETDNIYIISKTILDADVFINVPKLKTHKLGGITASLKNLVGTCVVKNSLPHHTIGSPDNFGDKYKEINTKNLTENKLKRYALSILKLKNPLINYPFILIKKIAGIFLGSSYSDTIRNGSWYGNDTIWRTTLDLNKILLYCNKNGEMQDTLQRKYISIIDGIIAGEGKGPMEPDPKNSGLIIIGTNPVEVDTVAATLMGYDYKKISTINNAYLIKNYRLTNNMPDDIIIKSNIQGWEKVICEFAYKDTLKFKPHFGWKGNIEIDK